MRLALGWLGVSLVGGCASPPMLAAERQVCIECALRENTANVADAAERFSRWCERGDARSCSVLGVMYEQGRGVERDPKRAVQLFGRACRQNNARACVSLGRMMHDGTAARPDPLGAATMFESACHQGELDGCFLLGRVLGASGEERRAAALLGETCNKGHAPSCDELGVMAQQGRGVKQSAQRAEKLFRRACRAGHVEACARL